MSVGDSEKGVGRRGFSAGGEVIFAHHANFWMLGEVNFWDSGALAMPYSMAHDNTAFDTYLTDTNDTDKTEEQLITRFSYVQSIVRSNKHEISRSGVCIVI